MERSAVNLARQQLIFKLELRATKGHGTDVDRNLMADAAGLIRNLLDLPEEGGLDLLPTAQYGPVRNDPPIGHSLPIPDPKEK